ncbi:DNA-directed RNA polymerases II, IV and V subunit 8B-like isoform X1 [Primulina huaijiensis]|uniref:DNA-directed RNA polymerases II, IV and V subunit 8B-like isoform X1 n=1 Tax=Primulina huaijiensis TaxID=1492673 RepID=UPI003CC71BE4
MAEFYFDEIIKVHKVDNQVVYDKVSRIIARSEVEEFYLELDVNKEIYPMLPSEKYRMVITNTLLMDGSAVTCYFLENCITEFSSWDIYINRRFFTIINFVCSNIWAEEFVTRLVIYLGKQKSLADKFEYVMHGLSYKMSEVQVKTDDGNSDAKVAVYVSFGGLQLLLRGDPLKVHKFKVDQKLFLLLRKI